MAETLAHEVLSSDTAISLQGLERTFSVPGHAERIVGLARTDLVVRTGEILCLVGPSGCGKTTLLNILAGFDKPTAGTVKVGDALVAGPSPERIVVFQEPLVYPWLRVIDNVSFGPSLRREPRRKVKDDARELVRAIGLAGFEHAYPYQLSGGMRQRVALARALINRPKVLLMDEPFSALDAQTRLQMQQLFLDVWLQHRTTTVFITHDIDEAIFIADRVGVMQGRPGRIAAIFDVEIPRPRTVHTTTSSTFVELKDRILSLLWN